MVQTQSLVSVCDNSGVKLIMCIRKSKIAKVGNIILGVVKETLPNTNLKKKFSPCNHCQNSFSSKR